jgi:hypothetical protein
MKASRVLKMFENVFVLSTGRCGSTTFARACAHFNNYTSGHETRSHFLGSKRFAYPSFHIESDNRLTWLLGRLEKEYGDAAFYVHLTRNLDDTAKSFAKRDGGIMAAYQGDGIIMGCKETNQYDIACDYVNTVNENIRLFLKDKTNKMNFSLEHGKRDFERFIQEIEAKGNLEGALGEFEALHNASISKDENRNLRKKMHSLLDYFRKYN